MQINDTLSKLPIVSAQASQKFIGKRFPKAPYEPWFHLLMYGKTFIWYIWDTREIVHVEFIENDNQRAALYGMIAKVRSVVDNHTKLNDKHGLLKNLPTYSQLRKLLV